MNSVAGFLETLIPFDNLRNSNNDLTKNVLIYNNALKHHARIRSSINCIPKILICCDSSSLAFLDLSSTTSRRIDLSP